MNKISLIFLGLTAIILIGCNGNDSENDESNLNKIDSIIDLNSTDSIIVDTTSVLADSLVEAGYVDELEETASVIEKIYGEQWDFCDCAVKNDSINKAIANSDDLSDAEFDIIFARLDVIDQHCKELLTAPNTTPDERAKHKRKIRKCLKNAK